VGWAREMVVGGRRQSRRSVVVVWGVSGAKCGRLQSIAVRGLGRRRRWLGASPDCRGWASPVRSVAAMVEGGGGRGSLVGPVGGGRSVGRRRRGRRKRF
jgi:hypothetical protein